MSRRARWLRRILIGVLIGGVTSWLIAPSVARALIRSRIRRMIADQFDAQFEIGELVYHAPYGVTLMNSTLIAPGPDGKPLELLRVPRLELRLAKSPLSRGPLVIESLVITEPAVHLIRTQAGMTGCRRRGQENSTGTSTGSASAPARAKLSELLRLTRFALQGGQVIYEDRTRAAVPLVWKNLNVDLDTSQQSDASYSYHLVVNNAPLATLEASGSADLDDLILRVEKCALSVNVDPNTPESAVSAELQEPLRAWRARGTLNINMTGTLPLSDPSASTYQTTLQLSHASARVPGWQTPLEDCTLKLVLSDGSEQPVDGRPAPGERPTARIELAQAHAGDAIFRMHDALAVANRSKMTWTLTGLEGHFDPGSSRAALPKAVRDVLAQLRLHGAMDFKLDDASGSMQGKDVNAMAAHLELTPQEFSLQPPGVGGPIDGITPVMVSVEHGDLTIHGVRGTCDGNLLYVKQASVKLADLLEKKIHVHDLSGCLTFGPEQKYPPALADVLDQCKPVGPYFFEGSIDIDTDKHQDKVGYDIKVHTKRGRLTVTDRHIPITSIDTVVNVTPEEAVISRFEAAAFNGSVSATGIVNLQGKKSYDISAALRDVDLADLSRYLATPGQPSPSLAGQGVGTVQLAGSIPSGKEPVYQSLTGSGEFEVLGADFWRIPIMKSITDSISTKQALTVGEAAGEFHIGNGKVHFDRALASAPVLGVAGSGDVDFDGNLDFKLIANALGKWSERIGDVGDGGGVGKMLDTVQKGMDVASKQALYEVDVTGTASKPQSHAVPSPFLNKQIRKLLGETVDKSRKNDLLDTLHNDPTPTTGPTTAR